MIENCSMRHENGNCIPVGGFCTANKNICEALLNAYRMGKEQLSKESTTSDMISRQAAIDALKMDISIIPFAKAREYVRAAIETIYNRLEELPPAQPEPKEGEWEQVSAQRYFMSASYFYRCSACGVNNVRNTNYCPNCGAKMKGAKHETN